MISIAVETDPAPVRHTCQHRRYRMSCDKFDQLRMRSGDRCEICGVAAHQAPRGMMFIDHDPALGIGAVRGLLCCSCNSTLGGSLTAADNRVAAYLVKPWRTCDPRPRRAFGATQPIRSVKRQKRAAEIAPSHLRETFKEVNRLGVRKEQLQQNLNEVKEHLAAKVIEAIAAGATQTRICEISGLARETVRQLCLEKTRQEPTWRKPRSSNWPATPVKPFANSA